MKLYIIRHLQTEWNAQGVLQGRYDVPVLTPSPEQMAQIAMQKQTMLSNNITFDVVLASELQRTQQTAQYYGFTQVLIESLLNELNFGVFEKRPKKDLLAAFGDAWFEAPGELVLGEPMRDLEDRLQAFLLKYQHHKHVLVFSHGAWTRAMISLIQCGHINQMNKVTVQNNQLIELVYDKGA